MSPPTESFDHLPAFMRRRPAQSDITLHDTSSATPTPPNEEPLSYPPSETSTSAPTSAMPSAAQSPNMLPHSLALTKAQSSAEATRLQLQEQAALHGLPPLPESILEGLPPGAILAPDGTIIPPPPTEAELAAAKREPPTKRLRFIDEEVGFILVDAEEYMKIKKAREPEPWIPPGQFPFFSLPTELRMQILTHHLVLDETIDLDPLNARNVATRLNVLLVSQRMHDEAAAIFYGENAFRLFPVHGRFFHTKHLLLQRIVPRYRELMGCVEIRLGPGWSKPPKTWNVEPKSGVLDLKIARKLKIFVECDPSSDVFKGFRVNDNFYTLFSCELVSQLKMRAPTLATVEFDGFPSVKRGSPLMSNLVATAEGCGLKVVWAPDGRWGRNKDLVEALRELKLE